LIVIDTHIWIWWVHDHHDLKPWMRRALIEHESDGIGISAISCWEIARLNAGQKIDLHAAIEEWFDVGLNYPGVVLLDLTPPICIEANRLDGFANKDPADRMIVATARVHACDLLTADSKILDFDGVRLLKEPK
jgi:PIN domain nuclease of toxin-antitoxin system